MFHKAAWKHYSGKVKNVYITVRRIYSGQYTPNFIRIGWVSFEIYDKNILVCFSGSQCICAKMEVFELSHKVCEGSLHYLTTVLLSKFSDNTKSNKLRVLQVDKSNVPVLRVYLLNQHLYCCNYSARVLRCTERE